MHENDNSVSEVNRRSFLQTGAIATASAMTVASATGSLAAPPAVKKTTLPVRPLGNTGATVTILNLGTWKSPGTDRLLRFAYSNGVRYFDTAKSYGSEPAIARWLQAMPEVRKEIFLATKDHPNSPRDLIPLLDSRLAALQTDYLDLFFIHGIGSDYGPQSMDWPKSKELKETIETIKKSGKARFVGISCHDPKRAEYIQAAADGGFVDVVMLQFTPWLEKDAPLNRALDACHKRGIGLVSMKQVAGHGELEDVVKRVPTLKEKGLTPYQGLLHAIWSDERISSCCVSMRNTDQITENSLAASGFTAMNQAEIEQLRDACLAAGPTFCADCDGRCARAAGTDASLGDLTRLLTYHDQYGYRNEAKRLYSLMSESDRNWAGADLDAAQRACPNRLDFTALLPRIDRNLA
ncbi:aldo/keto reductase [Singulisphaera acidiphila]|uniref:Putative oxidoreductase of aldo/keto reductase family n=1 Tax=Singulisphaera acidiphila (strain ATCC BAA-1392 / DSM 18658 / VKM B-2454 / MOB10) TaxID=886293 RepID=L0DKR4_SINAD|nr:aldo/keto reductase [Singulisphaera acidiphila]AGA29410.1 putative oxidoreductase of aldo/keto reductase family [Singulisphaera acidiphila DSM 18658]